MNLNRPKQEAVMMKAIGEGLLITQGGSGASFESHEDIRIRNCGGVGKNNV